LIKQMIAGFLLAALVIAGAAAAQQQDQTTACFAPNVVGAANFACANVGAGQVCLGAGQAIAQSGDLASAGDTADLSTVGSLTGSAGALAIFKTQADLPDRAAPIQLVLFGEATITDAFTPLPEPYPTVTVKNASVNILNLRGAPSVNGSVVGTLMPGIELTADGRSSDSQWLHVQRENGAAWVYASLVTVNEGDDASQLYLLDSPIMQPMQSLTLTSAGADCAGGLLVEASGKDTAHLEVNGALLTFSSATLLLQAPDGQPLTVDVIKGSADVLANGTKVTAKVGAEVSIAADAAPELQDRYAFASLTSAPLTMLPQDSLVCVAGVNGGAAASLYRTPGTGNQAAGTVDPNAHVTVTGQTTASDGTLWYLVDNSRWVPQNDVIIIGVCNNVAQVSASVAQQPITNSSQNVPPASFEHNLLPQGQSIWQAHTGADHLSGTCSAPPIAQCDHLAAITTNADGTISWRGQEPQPYRMHATGPNSFAFSGRNGLNNANLSLTVTFTSETIWTGVMQLVYDNDGGCAHTFYYTAERIR
jgi:Bacterial SH3 domain